MRYKSLYLLSFSLAFLSKAMAYDYSYEYEDQYEIAEDGDDEYLPEAQYQSQKVSYSESNSSQECLSHFRRVHIGVRHNEARGIGYKDGYTTLEAFGIYDGYSKYFMPFIDLRGHVFNNGKLAGNAGIGERTLIPSINHTFGSFLYYDVRRVGKGLTVNQLSPGLELVGKRMEFHINGYFPVGRDKSRQYRYEFDRFKGNNIILKSKQYHAMRGGDAEIGAHLTQSTKYDLYASVGPYYLHSSHASTWGGRTRLLGRFKEYFSLEAAYSYDHLFRSVIEGSVAFTLPLGCKLKRTGDGCPQGNDLLLSRASFAPSRFEIPVVKRVHPKEKAINPATGKPWVVWFVNNTSSSDGTIKSPFPTLLQAQNASSPNDMIYVFPGDGTTTGMDMGITLQDGQSFFGSGIEQQFDTTKGDQTIPAMSGRYPSITNTAGTVVILGNGNVVSGFNISAPASFSAVRSVATGVNSATIVNNVITAVNFNAISIQGAGTVNIGNNQIASSSQTGILLTAVGGQMNGSINNNFISSGNTAVSINSGASGSYNMTIEGNAITPAMSYYGIFATMPGTSMFNIIGNTVTYLSGTPSAAGIHVQDDSTTVSGRLMIVGNQVVVSPAAALYTAIEVPLSSANSSNLSVAVKNNSAIAAGVAGLGSFDFTSGATDTMCLTLDKNNASGGYTFTATGSGVINIDSITANIGGPVASVGSVNLVAPNTCGN